MSAFPSSGNDQTHAGGGRAPVSVVIPAYNSGRWICEALESVFAQTDPPAQVIVVDDGSSDDTPARVRPYRDRIEYIRQANAGVSAARNRGVAAATGEFVAFLDSDDVWHPRKTRLQMEVFRRTPQLGVLSTPTYDWPAAGHPPVGDFARLPMTPVSWTDMAVKNRMNTSSVVVRRELLRRAGPFDVTMQGPEDRDMWLRLVQLAPGANLEIPLSGYRITPGGISQNPDKCRDGMLRILKKLQDGGAWQGRRWLRRKAYGYVNHACSSLYSDAGRQATALSCAFKSLAWYPLPFDPAEVAVRFERPRRLAVIALRLLGLKRRRRDCCLQRDESVNRGICPAGGAAA